MMKMIVSIRRDTGEFIKLKESENKDFKVLADMFARSTLNIWRELNKDAEKLEQKKEGLQG
ncbi:MAG: hypothetical protein E7200_06305 [Selenomonas ruminantium]|nr:hypothetical protein [Selenomonas ruminantium]